MRRSRRLIVGLALVGVGGLLMLIAAQRFDRPALIGPGLLLFALGIIAAGMDTILRRYIAERHSENAGSTVFVGPAAVLLGFTTVIVGLAFGAAGVAWTLGAEDRLYRHLLDRPGAVLLAAGLALGAAGAASVIGAREWRGSTGRFLARVPERIGGAILLLLGLALLAGGAFETASPAGFDGAVHALLAPLRAAVP